MYEASYRRSLCFLFLFLPVFCGYCLYVSGIIRKNTEKIEPMLSGWRLEALHVSIGCEAVLVGRRGVSLGGTIICRV